ncbi:hypothetical protein [Botrimarina mediterranea]|uniref:Uncharacterized protein n=1 Tax=Botrimarina mediterranea TaxID=2528022 RepID=A0A518K281_9BACT|nr:hypothetical protein [Botrimarina mediterranea]QDV71877.1 hypothetical protein Spa11_00460 [Botrimarina mediterranea]
MSPRVTGRVGRGNPANAPAASPADIARCLRELAEETEALADKHTERLDYEGYSGLAERAAELKAVAKAILAEDLAAVIAEMIAQAEDHLSSIHELCEEGGAS